MLCKLIGIAVLKEGPNSNKSLVQAGAFSAQKEALELDLWLNLGEGLDIHFLLNLD